MKREIVWLMGILLISGLLVACADREHHQVVDVRPIADGLRFLGMAGVLAALVIVYGNFVSATRLTGYIPYILAGLFILLALVVAAVAVPVLIIPITIALVALVVVAVLNQRFR